MHLLAIEWLKLKKYRTFWILIGFFALLLPLWNMGVSNSVLKISSSKNGVDIFNKAYTFDQVWANMGWWASLFIVFLSILVMVITTNEFSFKTNRQNLIDGWTRLQVLHAKWLVVLVLAVASTLYVFITGVLFGITYDDMSHFPGNLNQLFFFFILSLNYCSFALLIAYLVKRSGLAIGVFFLYNMFGEKLVQAVFNWKLPGDIGNLLPLQASDELLPFPLMQMAQKAMQQEQAFSNSTYVLVSVAWIVIYYLTSRMRLLRTDW